MRNALLASGLLLGLSAVPAFAQLGSPTASTPLTTSTGVANGQNSGTAQPTNGNTYVSTPNGRNSGRANPVGEPVVGTGVSGPASDRASNIAGGPMASPIAPHLPTPSTAANATPQQLLAAAQADLRARRTGAAQEALERAETRLLDRSTAGDPSAPDMSPMVKQVSDARMALGHGDSAGASRIIASALAQ